jgi:alanine dehydrogenase
VPLLLTREELAPLMNLAKAVELTEAAFHEQARGHVVPHAPYHIHVGNGGALRIVSGALLESQRMGVRLGPSAALGGGERMYAVLFEATTGDLLSFMGYPFGTVRTAANVALATKYMARGDARTVGLFGVGRNALGLLEGVCLMRKVSRIVVSSRDAERRKTFCEKASHLLGITVIPANDPEQAVRGVDVVLTATNSLSAVFPADWIEPGLHLCSMGKPSELDPAVYAKADRVVVGCREHEQKYFDRSAPLPLEVLVNSGRLSWEQVHEMGEVVSRRFQGRETDSEVTLFRESQGGFGDMMFAGWLYEEAKRRGLGREMAL